MTINYIPRFVLLAFGIVLFITLFRIAILIITPMELFFDEAQYWAWGQALDFGYFSKPPVLAWLIRLFTELFGHEDYAIRVLSPILYGATALVAGLLAARMAPRFEVDKVHAFLWVSVLFVVLPGVSFATRLVSTDAPLLLFFALALYFLDRLRFDKTYFNAAFLGGALGFGLMAKYAMVYFVLCFCLWAFINKEGRHLLFSKYFSMSLILAFLILSPNLYWNASHDWITFQHTKDNGNWQSFQLHFDHMFEFIGAQIGIMGPVLFLLLIIGLFFKRQFSNDIIFLLAFSLPIQVLMIVQATLSRAHANWAAVSFIALSVLAVLWALKWRSVRLLIVAAALHFTTLFVFAGADIYADKLVHTRFGAAYKRVFGWQALSSQVDALAKKHEIKTLIADRRNIVAQMLYHLRDEEVTINTWSADGRVGNYYEMVLPYKGEGEAPILILSSCQAARQLDGVRELPKLNVPVRKNYSISVYPYLTNKVVIEKKDVC